MGVVDEEEGSGEIEEKGEGSGEVEEEGSGCVGGGEK